jgi:uncharacterized protein
MRLLSIFAAGLALWSLTVAEALAEKRVALVIGNGQYVSPSRKLPNAPNDARAVERALKAIDFEVIPGINLDRIGMETLLSKFLDEARTAQVALLFYAGHGLQVDGHNYLIPVDAKIESRSDLNFRAVELDRILASFDNPSRANIIILDACRDNPLTRSFAAATRSASVAAGLAAYTALGTGTLIAFSTAPGAVAEDGSGANSPFTASLIKHLPTPGIEIRQMLTRVRADVARATSDTQVPWDNSSLRGDVYLAGLPIALSPDEIAWNSLAGTTDIAALRRFAVQYPGSKRRDEVTVQITVLESKVAEDRRQAEEEREKIAALPSPATRPAVSAIGDCNRLAAGSLAKIDAAQAVPACRAALAARPGDSMIAFQLGRSLTYIGSKEADLEAVRFLQEANSNGVVAAAPSLGVMYERGRGGLAKDEREAVRLYRLAAEQGYARGQSNLGNMYERGRGGLAKDEREAVRLYKLAADQGFTPGQYNLGFMYAQGRGGLAKDDGEAVRLYKLAADQRDAGAQSNLGLMYGQGRGGLAKDDGEAVRLYKLAADQGNSAGQSNLGSMYAEGRGGLAKDDGEAVRLYKLAADQGNSTAQSNLGSMYAEGRGGLAKDDGEALRLYRLAADQGNESAKLRVEQLAPPPPQTPRSRRKGAK